MILNLQSAIINEGLYSSCLCFVEADDREEALNYVNQFLLDARRDRKALMRSAPQVTLHHDFANDTKTWRASVRFARLNDEPGDIIASAILGDQVFYGFGAAGI